MSGWGDFFRSAQPNLGTLEQGCEFFRADLWSDTGKNVHFTFEIAINEPPVTQRVPILLLMKLLRDRVAETVEKFGRL